MVSNGERAELLIFIAVLNELGHEQKRVTPRHVTSRESGVATEAPPEGQGGSTP